MIINNKRLWRCLTLLVAMYLGMANCARANSETLSFANLDEVIQITRLKDNVYQTQQGVLVQFENRLIVGTREELSISDIKSIDKSVSGIDLLFTSFQLHFYAITLARPSINQTILNYFSQHPKINLVQPDLLQLKKSVPVKLLSGKRFNGARLWQHPGFSDANNPNHKHSHNKQRKDRTNNQNSNQIKRINSRYQRYLQSYSIDELWASSKGSGVTVAIIDDGFSLSHQELLHVIPAAIYDADKLGATTEVDLAAQGGNLHGTKVLSIFASSHNVGFLKGIVPEARFLLIKSQLSWTSSTLRALNFAHQNNADIINCSWHTMLLLEPVKLTIDALAEHGRRGKGVAIVFSAGNEGVEILANSHEAAIDSAIVIGANNALGKRVTKSNYGATVDLYLNTLRVKAPTIGNQYEDFSSTSLSAAITSSFAALYMSITPNIELSELTRRLTESLQSPKSPQSTILNKPTQ